MRQEAGEKHDNFKAVGVDGDDGPATTLESICALRSERRTPSSCEALSARNAERMEHRSDREIGASAVQSAYKVKEPVGRPTV